MARGPLPLDATIIQLQPGSNIAPIWFVFTGSALAESIGQRLRQGRKGRLQYRQRLPAIFHAGHLPRSKNKLRGQLNNSVVTARTSNLAKI